MNPNNTAPAPAATGTGATNTVQEEGLMPDSTHRPARATLMAPRRFVATDIPDRPQLAAATIDVSTLTAKAVFVAGGLRIEFDDVATAELWASAMQVTATQLRVATDHANELRSTEMHAAAGDYDDHGRVDV